MDLKRRRRLATRVSKQLLKVKVVECAAQCWNTLAIPCKHDQATYQMRYVFAYALDSTDLPCYILWPIRTEDNSFWCLDAWKGDWIQLDRCILEASSVASDQNRFDAAYEAFRDLSEGLYDIDTRQYARGVTSDDAPGIMLSDGQAKLRELVHLSRNWPLARLTIPLGGLSKQMDRLLEGTCFEILATNTVPDAHHGKVIQTATHLILILAEYRADTMAWLMRSILDP